VGHDVAKAWLVREAGRELVQHLDQVGALTLVQMSFSGSTLTPGMTLSLAAISSDNTLPNSVTLSNNTATLHSSNEMTHFVSMHVAYIAIAQIDKLNVGRFDLHYGPRAKPTVVHFTDVLWG